MDQRIKVLIADDHRHEREGMRKLLSLIPNIEVIGEAETAHQAADMAVEKQPHVVLMDLKWHKDPTAGSSGIKVIKERAPHVRILAMTAYPEYIEAARMAGADMGVDKDVLDSPEKLSDLIGQLVRSTAFPVPPIHEADVPTEHELKILQMIAVGDSDEAIAHKLNLKLGVAKRQIADLYDKIGARNRASAISIAYERGWLRKRT